MQHQRSRRSPKALCPVVAGQLCGLKPLHPGFGVGSDYLTEVSPTFAEVLAGLIGQEAQSLTMAVEVASAAEGDAIETGNNCDF